MRSKTKIIVLHLKELIYTGIILILGLFLLFFLLGMFRPQKSSPPPSQESSKAVYLPGKYTTTLLIGNSTLDVEVVVDSSCITSVRLENLTEAITTMYPLMEPCMETLSRQIYETQSLDNLTYPEENQYTARLLTEAVSAALQKAKLPDTP